MVKHEALKNHLETLRNSIPELRGVLLASTEGLPVAHSLSNGTDPNRVAAMAAAASSLGRRISESMATGTLSEVSIRGDDGVLFVYSAGPKAVLAVMGPMARSRCSKAKFPRRVPWLNKAASRGLTIAKQPVMLILVIRTFWNECPFTMNRIVWSGPTTTRRYDLRSGCFSRGRLFLTR